MTVGAILVAGGRGERLGGEVPKQLLEIGGRSLLRRSLDVLAGHPQVSSIVVVLPAAIVPQADELVGEVGRPMVVVAGGDRRQDSVALGFAALTAEAEVVLVHDAARPFADEGLVSRVIDAAGRHGAAVPAVAARDTVKQADEHRFVAATVPRESIWLAQTPQGFARDVLARAIARGQGGVEATDEAMLVEAGGERVAIVEGSEANVKITTSDDFERARARVEGVPGRVGTGYDLHRLAGGRPLVLAGITVDAGKGPVSHSDGDVVCHAVVDALLGAAAAGDIGQHFPNTDARWQDAPGLDLLARAKTVIEDHGWTVTNVDVTVVLERPKLAPHTASIRERLADTLGLAADAVGVKAKTNEGVDAVGRGEAIAAHAVVMLAAGRPRR